MVLVDEAWEFFLEFQQHLLHTLPEVDQSITHAGMGVQTNGCANCLMMQAAGKDDLLDIDRLVLHLVAQVEVHVKVITHEGEDTEVVVHRVATHELSY